MRANRGHHPDAQIRRAEPCVYVHAADEETPDFLLERDLGLLVSPPLGDALLVPPREGMGGRGDDRGAVAARPVDDDASGFVEALAKLVDGRADPRTGLDLGAKELVDDLVRPRLATQVSMMAGSGSAMTSRVSASTTISSSSMPRVRCMAVSSRECRRRVAVAGAASFGQTRDFVLPKVRHRVASVHAGSWSAVALAIRITRKHSQNQRTKNRL